MHIVTVRNVTCKGDLRKIKSLFSEMKTARTPMYEYIRLVILRIAARGLKTWLDKIHAISIQSRKLLPVTQVIIRRIRRRI